MTPAARIQAAIETLEGFAQSKHAADRFIQNRFRGRRYAGSKDRAAIAERVFDILRHRASFAWRMRSESPRALAIASLLAAHEDVDAHFDGSTYGPAPLSGEERALIASAPREEMPHWVRFDYPEFLAEELKRSLGDRLEDEMCAMMERACVDLRVNMLKTTRSALLTELREAGFDAAETPYSPLGIRMAPQPGLSQLRYHRTYRDGQFEFQDEASQIVAILVGAKPGESIFDIAAGAGGKALAMAADMKNQGKLCVHDWETQRLRKLLPRAARAGVTIAKLDNYRKHNAVLLDAPCSGSGTWRRQPELKWRLTEERLKEVQDYQFSLMFSAENRVRSGGRMVYATCSLLRSENEDQIDVLRSYRPDMVVKPAAEMWREVTNLPPPPGMGEFFRATPATTGTDGFFAAVIFKKDG